MNRPFSGPHTSQGIRAGLAILALALASTSAPASAAISGISATSATSATSDVASYADRLLTEAYPATGPGAAVLVMQDGKPVLRKGYGLANVELGVPIQSDMVFELGSITKQFTATAILMLAERGRISLTDDVTKYLPDYPTHGRSITVEHLLTHTSGIPSYTGLPEWLPKMKEDFTPQQIIDLFKDKPLEFEPGERWAYSNSGYILLGAILEKVSGKTYEDFVEQEIFKPLGMTRSFYGNNAEIVSGRVDGYDQDGSSPMGFRRAGYLSMTQPYAAGSLLSTVDDLARWDEALIGAKLLKPASLDRMFTPVNLKSGRNTGYAYGWGIGEYAGRKVIEHGGDINGFTTDILRVPEARLLVVILSNNTGKDNRPLAFQIAARALGKPTEEWPVIALDAKALDEYVGVYRFADGVTRTITRDGDKLFSQRSGGEKLEIVPTLEDEFFFKEPGTRLRFQRDAQGRIANLDYLPRFGMSDTGARTDEVPVERQAIRIDSAVLDAYAGVYELAPGFQLTVSRDGDHLFAQATGQEKAEIFPESDTKFFLKVVDAQLVFVRGGSGQAESLVLHQGGRETPAKRVK
jgi:CubicO group peptidase (beta-lactamase class C family)